VHFAAEPRDAEGTTVRYIIEHRGSTFTVKAFATGLLSMFGHSPTIAIPGFKGEASLNPDALEQSSLRMGIQSSSLTVTDDISNKDRDEINRAMHEDVLESNSFPDIVFECSRVSASKTGEGLYWVALNGELTLHGVTRNQSVLARVSVNGQSLRATGEFSVRMSDYEIRPVSAVGGTVRLKDELKLSFAINARQQV
jgi:polyisoprenoid-binding protein YceI